MPNGVQNIYFNSADRLFGSDNTNAQMIINDLCEDTEKDIRVNSLYIPHSYYSINQYNNTFGITGVSGYQSVTLIKGSYDYTTFPTVLSAALVPNIGATCSVSYSQQTGKIQISTTANFSITTNEINYRYLGLQQNTIATSTSGILTSSYPVNLDGTSVIHLVADGLRLQSTNSHTTNNNILCSVRPNANFQEAMTYKRSEFSQINLADKIVSAVNFRLLDEDFHLIDLNNQSWNINLDLIPNE